MEVVLVILYIDLKETLQPLRRVFFQWFNLKPEIIIKYNDSMDTYSVHTDYICSIPQI